MVHYTMSDDQMQKEMNKLISEIVEEAPLVWSKE
jgi:hypothetical protein